MHVTLGSVPRTKSKSKISFCRTFPDLLWRYSIGWEKVSPWILKRGHVGRCRWLQAPQTPNAMKLPFQPAAWEHDWLRDPAAAPWILGFTPGHAVWGPLPANDWAWQKFRDRPIWQDVWLFLWTTSTWGLYTVEALFENCVGAQDSSSNASFSHKDPACRTD
jgi:hypothetical protein